MRNKLGIFLLAIFLTACAPAMIPVQTSSPTSATASESLSQLQTPSPISVLITSTVPPFPSPLPRPTLPPTIPPTATFSPKPIPVSTATEIYPLDNLRMAYIVDGNLYVQNGSNSPKKISDSGRDWYPVFSDDGEKIVFYRGKNLHDNNSVFSVNADGSHMQEIITTAWLDTLGAGTKAGPLMFIPNTHQILFNTYLCPDDDNVFSGCTVGIFLADTDTGRLKAVMTPALGGRLLLGGVSHWGGNFSISPDGKSLSIAHSGQIDVLSIDGKAVRRSIMKYPPGMPAELYPRMYWFSDSSGLIVALPAETEYRGWWFSGDPAYTIWKYTFDENVATQIFLEPTLFWTHMESNDVISISPNREWIIYFGENYQVYRGNLLSGDTDLVLPYKWYLPTLWSPDSIHFSDGATPEGSILGSINALPDFAPGFVLGWIDAKRFIYIPFTAHQTKDDVQLLIGEIDGEMVFSYESNVSVPNVAPYSYSFVFTVIKGN